MSDAPSQSTPPSGGPGNRLLTFLGAAGAILVFLFIMLVAYLPNRPGPVDAAAVEQRLVTLQESEAAGLARTTAYEVVNPEAGTVRIPVERAMELTLRDYAAGGEAAAPEGDG